MYTLALGGGAWRMLVMDTNRRDAYITKITIHGISVIYASKILPV